MYFTLAVLPLGVLIKFSRTLVVPLQIWFILFLVLNVMCNMCVRLQRSLRCVFATINQLWCMENGYIHFNQIAHNLKDVKFKGIERICQGDSSDFDRLLRTRVAYCSAQLSIHPHGLNKREFRSKGWFPVLRFFDLRIRTECSKHVNSFIDAYWEYVRKRT